jgi:hypothetical protein
MVLWRDLLSMVGSNESRPASQEASTSRVFVSYSARDFELFLLLRDLRFLACHAEEKSGGSL